MRVYDIRDAAGQVVGFEVDRLMLGRRGAAQVVRRIPGVASVTCRFRREEFCQFELAGATFVIREPWNRSPRYWVGPKPEAHVDEIEAVREAFRRAVPLLGLVVV